MFQKQSVSSGLPMPQNTLVHGLSILWFSMPHLKRILITGGAAFLAVIFANVLLELVTMLFVLTTSSLARKMLLIYSTVQILNLLDTTLSIHFGLRLMKSITSPALPLPVTISTIPSNHEDFHVWCDEPPWHGEKVPSKSTPSLNQRSVR